MTFWKPLLFLIVLCLGMTANAQPNVIRVAVFEDQVTLIQALAGPTMCRELEQIDVGENQMVFEYFLLCNLIKMSVPDAQFKLIGFPVVQRVVKALVDGYVDVSGFGVWFHESSSEFLLHSKPLLKKGEFSKGLYTTSEILTRYRQAGAPLLKSLIAVSNKNWTYDWQLLECSDLNVIHVDKYSQMFNVVKLGRADVLPLAFGGGNDLTRTEFGIKLYPLPGVKLVIPDASHYVFSKRSEYSLVVSTSLDASLDKMRENETLQGWYLKIGVVNPAVNKWATICPDP